MTIFEKIIAREIAAEILHEDALCIAIHDVAPSAPTHILIIPKIALPRISASTVEDIPLLGHLLLTASTIGQYYAPDGFRIVINNGSDAGESVPHLHIHVLGGRPLTWPPG